MPTVSTVNRFDNAPAHLIILSPRFCTRDKMRESENAEAKAEAAKARAAIRAAAVAEKKEARALAWSIEMTRRAAEREAIRARERHAREELAARKAREGRAKKKIEKEKKPEVWLDTRPAKRVKVRTAHNRARDAEQKRERYAAKVAALKASIPAGWVQSSKLNLNYSVSGLNIAMKKGLIRAVKIGRYWYCDPIHARDYSDSKSERSKTKMNKAIKARWNK